MIEAGKKKQPSQRIPKINYQECHFSCHHTADHELPAASRSPGCSPFPSSWPTQSSKVFVSALAGVSLCSLSPKKEKIGTSPDQSPPLGRFGPSPHLFPPFFLFLLSGRQTKLRHCSRSIVVGPGRYACTLRSERPSQASKTNAMRANRISSVQDYPQNDKIATHIASGREKPCADPPHPVCCSTRRPFFSFSNFDLLGGGGLLPDPSVGRGVLGLFPFFFESLLAGKTTENEAKR